jgi:exosortase A-associated hydrolase 1
MEEPIQFTCKGKRLYGILHLPEREAPSQDVVIMVTGGPQTRYGSHRLYVQLARFLCERGIAVFRFDYEGMGDSEGEFVAAGGAEPSIHAAVQYIDTRFPEGNQKIIWSLCDGASASALYASRYNNMVAGLILCNPLIHDKIVLYKKQYYKKRLLEKEFWMRLLGLKTKFKEVILGIVEFLNAMLIHTVKEKFSKKGENPESFTNESFLPSLQHIRIPIYCILSENDDVANGFREKISSRKAMKALQKNRNIKISTIKDADHTFTRPDTQEALFSLTARLLRETGFGVARQDEFVS